MSALPIGTGGLLLAALLVLLDAAVSLALRLGLERRLLLAALRATLQLALLGLVLEWVFAARAPALVVALMVVMAGAAGLEAARRASRRLRWMRRLSMLVMLCSSMLVTLYGLLVVLRVDPWWSPRYALPILGMVLGNTLNGISLGLDRVLVAAEERRTHVEILLAHGAAPAQAMRDVVREAVRTGMIPILNAMVATGLISIPGMMTGQILAGAPPAEAVRYQLFILFAIAGGVALGTIGVVLGASRLLFDERGRLRLDRLSARR